MSGAMARRRLKMSKLSPIRRAGRKFDIAFWQAAGAEARWAAAWEMTRERMAIRGINGRQRRLQRSVQNTEYLPRTVSRRRRTRGNVCVH